MVRQQRLRKWHLTYHNYTEETIRDWQQLGESCLTEVREGEEEKVSDVRYFIFAKEVGSENSPHLQGYIELMKKMTLSSLKSLLGSGLHAEKAQGSAQQNKVYCSKEGIQFWEYGKPAQESQGRRSDLESIREMVSGGATELEIATSFFGTWVSHHRAIARYGQLIQSRVVTPNYQMSSFPESWQEIIWDWTTTQILWGSSGIGKTEFACAVLPGALMVSHLDDLSVFNPEVHSGIIFDDVDIGNRPRTGQIHIVDQTMDRSIHIRYACAFIPKNTKKIFTTNVELGMCMDLMDPAIKRRCSVHHLVAL